MKKIMSAIVLSILLVGCTGGDADTSKVDTPTESNEITEEKTDVQQVESDEKVMDNQSVDEETSSNHLVNDESHISNESNDNIETRIPYPVFTGIKNEELVNQLISNYVNELNQLYNVDNPAALSINYQVMFQDEQYLSIYFSGNLSGGPYPSIFKSTLNIDLDKASRVTLSQMVNLNDEFSNLVTEAFQEQFNSIGVHMDDIFPLGIKDKLGNADTYPTSDVQSYFTSDQIVIILGVPHAIGDYVEVSIPLTSVENVII